MHPPPQAEPTITDETIGKARTPMYEDHDERYGVPTLEELGFDVEGLKPAVWIGGETEALGEMTKNLRSILVTNIYFPFSPLGKAFRAKGLGCKFLSSQNVPTIFAC